MSRRWRGRTLWWILVVAVVAAAAYGGVRYRSANAFQPAAFTPDSPEVEALRSAVEGANIVLVVLDATRADHVGCYGYPRETTPNIDRLAQSAVVFEKHFSQSSETKSSTASLLTSQYCDTHLSDGPRGLLSGTFTLEQGLSRAGLRTAVFSSNLKVSPAFGLATDFDHQECDAELIPRTRAEERWTQPEVLVRAFRAWLEEQDGARFFAYLHFMPPHTPYAQPGEMTELFDGLEPVSFRPGDYEFPEPPRPVRPTPPALPEWINVYDANLRYGDWAMGEVESALREFGVFDDTLFIVTSDHGEGFGEHGYVWHGRGVYDDNTHIPLVMRLPGGEGGGLRIHTLSQTIDLFPTILDLLRVEYPRNGAQGQSLLPVVAGLTDGVHDCIFARAGGPPSKYLVRSLTHSLILWDNGEWRALYDLESDPGQRQNVMEEQPEAAEELIGVFRDFAEKQRRPPRDFLDPEAEVVPLPSAPLPELTPEQEKHLRNMGYLL